MSRRIAFVFSNPRHHAEILLPVVRELQARGETCHVISLAELRGLETPPLDTNGARLDRLLPIRRRNRGRPVTVHSNQQPRFDLRRAVQRVAWTTAIGPRLRWLLRDSDVVVIPNDSVFPYLQLVKSLITRNVPVVLVQEGIRFRLPSDDDSAYGKNGARKVCVWGEGSSEFFQSIGVPAGRVEVTGNPRFDNINPESWKRDGEKALSSLQLHTRPLLFLSNPIELQGYGSVEKKLALFETFLRESRDVLARANVPVVVKLHPAENVDDFRNVASRVKVPVTLSTKEPLFALLATARAAVVLASTVGLEALVFGLPLGVLQIPGHDYAFEYVDRGVGKGLATGSIAAGLESLLEVERTNASSFVERHLANRGSAKTRIADAILSVVTC